VIFALYGSEVIRKATGAIEDNAERFDEEDKLWEECKKQQHD